MERFGQIHFIPETMLSGLLQKTTKDICSRERLEGGYICRLQTLEFAKWKKEGKMKAVVSITIDDEFVVHDIKVIEGEKGLFIAMPSRKAGDGDFRDIAHPINSATRDQIQGLILKKYEEVLQEKE